MITELTLVNFRGFRSLELKGLKPVNLITGHNNSGKTSLLEGLWMLCGPRRAPELPGLFRAAQGSAAVRYFRWLLRDGAPEGQGAAESKTSEGSVTSLTFGHPEGRWREQVAEKLRVQFGGGLEMGIIHGKHPVPCRIVSVQHREAAVLVTLVGKAQRKRAGEETLERLLRVVDPRIAKVRVDPGEDGNQVVIDIGLSERMPVSQAGEGIYRLVTILADLIGETPEVLLIDEVENGLHHSIHEQVWKGLAATAAELKVQIFATTHSNECLHAAHRAFSSRKDYDLGVIQLFRVESGVQGRLLDQKHIGAALAGDIELRG